MPHEGNADPITNNGPRFHSNIPVRELTERVTQAIKASDVSSSPPVVEAMDEVTHETQSTPTEPNGAKGLGSLGPSARPTLGLVTLSHTMPRLVTPSRPIPRPCPMSGSATLSCLIP